MRRFGIGFSGLIRCSLIVVSGAAVVSAQNAGPPNRPVDPLDQPTTLGIRMTPGFARTLGRQVARDVFVGRYQLDEAQLDEAAELVARRIMAIAHELDGQGQEFLERFIEEQIRHQVEQGTQRGSIPPLYGFAQEFGERVGPMMGTIREMVRGISRDVRPMLPAARQLLMARDLLAFETAFSALEENINRWAQGDLENLEDPFGKGSRKVPLDDDGQSPMLKNARQSAKRAVDQGEWLKWARYVTEAGEFYDFDDSQMASAKSILREQAERARTLTRNNAWRDRVYHKRLWLRMIPLFARGRRASPLCTYLEDEERVEMDPIKVLGNELKRRIDAIPTDAQRRGAQLRMAKILEEKGFVADVVTDVAQDFDADQATSKPAEQTSGTSADQAKTQPTAEAVEKATGKTTNQVEDSQ